MILIADSGSTKTKWEVVQSNGHSSVYSKGTNPFYQTTDEIAAIVKNELLPQLKETPDAIYFYGAGISQEDKKKIVSNALYNCFPKATIEVEHDLLAAARAGCGSAPGIACILGTGSNSCLYDGKKIIDNVPSLGFTLGDEGSGGHFGRELLRAYFYRELPDDVKKLLEAKHDMNRDHVLNKIYGSNMPNSVVASYAGFVTDNNTHPFIKSMIANCFSEFLQRHVSKYAEHKTLPINFIGSVAFLNQNILVEVLDKMGMKRGDILKSPMDGLVKFHAV